jgi:hypothetical protein
MNNEDSIRFKQIMPAAPGWTLWICVLIEKDAVEFHSEPLIGWGLSMDDKIHPLIFNDFEPSIENCGRTAMVFRPGEKLTDAVKQTMEEEVRAKVQHKEARTGCNRKLVRVN